MANWFPRFFGGKGSATLVHAPGHDIEVRCSARACRALAQRDRRLVVELELAFACMVHKEVRFHEEPVDREVFAVSEKLGLLVTTVIPDTCGAPSANTSVRVSAHRFMPKWVRIDHGRGGWSGEYGL
ncbi:MAG: hypothetical protein M0Z84_11850 [Gammaproteobacteria bacterium]|nr:hypothetical protein [Gammaproteobacteria bacterium]